MNLREYRGTSGGRSTVDDVLLALSDARRRYVVYFLLDRRSSTVDEMVDLLAGSDLVARGRAGDHDRVRVALHHNHLPKLHDAGIVLYEESRERVTLPELPDTVRSIVEWCREREDSP